MAKYSLDKIYIPTNEDNSIKEEREENNISNHLKLYPEDNITDDKDKIQQIELRLLKDYMYNNFSKMSDEDYEEFKESIKTVGIINPLTVRQITGGFEILAGHNRKRALEELGILKAPCIIKEVDDIEASVIMAVSNKQREKTNDIEWARSYRHTYELMKKEIGRPSNKCVHDGHINESDNVDKCVHRGHIKDRGRTIELLAEKYGISITTLKRKIRLAYLIDELADMFLKKKITQEQAEHLSYLKEDDQQAVHISLTEKRAYLTTTIAKELRVRAESSESLEKQDIYEAILSKKEEKVEVIKSYKVPKEYFKDNIKEKDKAEYIKKALLYIKENNIEL